MSVKEGGYNYPEKVDIYDRLLLIREIQPGLEAFIRRKLKNGLARSPQF